MNEFDAIDLRLLDALQTDASLSNQDLAARVAVSPATCLRRVKRLVDAGIVERRVALLSPDRLGAGLSAFLGLFALLKFPEPYHPVFEAESFRRASIDAFFVSIEVPEGTNPAAVAADVKGLGSIDVQVVEESER